jgi:hypothetical protein
LALEKGDLCERLPGDSLIGCTVATAFRFWNSGGASSLVHAGVPEAI